MVRISDPRTKSSQLVTPRTPLTASSSLAFHHADCNASCPLLIWL